MQEMWVPSLVWDNSLEKEMASHSGDLWRKNSRKNEDTEPMQKQYPVVHVTGDRNKV